MLIHGCTANRRMTKTYAAWLNMKSRCTHPSRKDWKHYGGRGITFCTEWAKFENFLQDMGDAPAGLTLDRIDTNGNYEPGNCRWVPWTVQSQNRRKRTHCRKGHFLSPDNLYVRRSGTRGCKICHQAYARTKHAERYAQRCAAAGKPMHKRNRKAPVRDALLASPLRERDLV